LIFSEQEHCSWFCSALKKEEPEQEQSKISDDRAGARALFLKFTIAVNLKSRAGEVFTFGRAPDPCSKI